MRILLTGCGGQPGEPWGKVAAQLAPASGQQDSHVGKRSLSICSSPGADVSLAESEAGRCGQRIPIAWSSQATLASHSGRYGRVHRYEKVACSDSTWKPWAKPSGIQSWW